MYMVGTPKKRVALQRSIARATTTGLKRSMSSRVAPANRGTFITPASPPAWNSGSADTTVSSPSAIWNHVANWIVFATRLACVSMAPFGVPVVPPVYMSNAGSACGSPVTAHGGARRLAGDPTTPESRAALPQLGRLAGCDPWPGGRRPGRPPPGGRAQVRTPSNRTRQPSRRAARLRSSSRPGRASWPDTAQHDRRVPRPCAGDAWPVAVPRPSARRRLMMRQLRLRCNRSPGWPPGWRAGPGSSPGSTRRAGPGISNVSARWMATRSPTTGRAQLSRLSAYGPRVKTPLASHEKLVRTDSRRFLMYVGSFSNPRPLGLQ